MLNPVTGMKKFDCFYKSQITQSAIKCVLVENWVFFQDFPILTAENLHISTHFYHQISATVESWEKNEPILETK